MTKTWVYKLVSLNNDVDNEPFVFSSYEKALEFLKGWELYYDATAEEIIQDGEVVIKPLELKG